MNTKNKMFGELAILQRESVTAFPFFHSIFAVGHDKNTRSRLLPKAASFPPGRETQGLPGRRASVAHTVQEVGRAAGSGRPPGGGGREGSQAEPAPLPRWPVAPPQQPAPQAPTEAAFLRKTQEMYVSAILLCVEPLGH